MNADGSGKHLVTDVGGVPAAWAPGPYLAFGCPGGGDVITLCAVRTDGSGITRLLGRMEANFPGWRPALLATRNRITPQVVLPAAVTGPRRVAAATGERDDRRREEGRQAARH